MDAKHIVPSLQDLSIETVWIASALILNEWQRRFACCVYVFSMREEMRYTSIASLIDVIEHFKAIFWIQNIKSFQMSPRLSRFIIYLIGKIQKCFTPIRHHVNQAFKRFNMGSYGGKIFLKFTMKLMAKK